MKKVLVLTYYWPPSGGSGVQRWMYFAKYLQQFGIEPIIITVDEKQASYKFRDESFDEKVKHLQTHRTPTVEPFSMYSKAMGGGLASNIPQGFAGESKPGLMKKIARFIRGNFFLPDARKGWNSFAYKKALEIIRKEKIDLLITTGPPHSTHLIGLKLKEKLGIRWIADFRDPWTEIHYNKYLFRTVFAKQIDASLEKKVLDNADSILTVGPSMKKLLEKKISPEFKEKINFIYNGYDAEAFSQMVKNKDEDFFTICHLGVLSDNQPVTPFLDAVKNLCETNPSAKSKIRIRFIGKISPSILTETNEKLSDIKIEVLEYVPHRDAMQHMMNADLLLNSFAEMEGSEILISGKLMEYLATGNPVLGLGNPTGDAAVLTGKMELVKIFSRTNISGITEFLEKVFLLWQNKTKIESPDVSQFSRFETTRQLSEIIKQRS